MPSRRFASVDPDKRRISLKACAGPGKTAVLAWCASWFLSTQGDRGEHPKAAAVSITLDNDAAVYEQTGEHLDVDHYRVLDELPAALVVSLVTADVDNLLADARVPEDAEAEERAWEQRAGADMAETRRRAVAQYGPTDGPDLIDRTIRWVRTKPALAQMLRQRGLGARLDIAFRRISLARFKSKFSRWSRFSSSRSLVVRPGRWPVSRSVCRTHRRNDSVRIPSFSPTDRIAAHCDGCSGAWSKTIRTARSRSSGEYLLGRGMGSILSRNGPSDKPGTFHPDRLEAIATELSNCGHF